MDKAIDALIYELRGVDDLYSLRLQIQHRLTLTLLWFIQKVNPYKDGGVSQRLFDLAENYNTRPGTNNYPGFSTTRARRPADG